MVLVAPHHIEGTPEHRLSAMMRDDVQYTPKKPWPADCMVQWGNGIVPANPFFEAFPAGTFLRGDGATIEEAEERAFAKWQTFTSCDHVWSRHSRKRGTYTNGAGWCIKCDSFKGQAFPPVFVFGEKRKPIPKGLVFMCEDDPEMDAIMNAKYPGDIKGRAGRKRELQIRRKLFGVTEKWF